MVRVRRKGREGGRFLLVSTALSQPDLDEIDKIFEEYDTSMAKNVLPGDLFLFLMLQLFSGVSRSEEKEKTTQVIVHVHYYYS